MRRSAAAARGRAHGPQPAGSCAASRALCGQLERSAKHRYSVSVMAAFHPALGWSRTKDDKFALEWLTALRPFACQPGAQVASTQAPFIHELAEAHCGAASPGVMHKPAWHTLAAAQVQQSALLWH